MFLPPLLKEFGEVNHAQLTRTGPPPHSSLTLYLRLFSSISIFVQCGLGHTDWPLLPGGQLKQLAKFKENHNNVRNGGLHRETLLLF